MSLPLCSSCGISDGEALSGLCAACLLRAGTAVAVDPAGDPFGPGSTIGPYEIVSTLGRGGMGHVYLAWDSRLCRTVAIKVLPAPFTADGDRTRRLEREARLVAGLNHPRICAVHDLGSDNGRTYVVMEHLQGETLADRLTRGALPLAEALTLACEIADGLDRAHQHGITHRDLKPANIMLTQSGAKLLDFGLAARTYVPDSGLSALSANHWSVIGGTLQYMAPEQLAGKAADARSDVFAFGLVLYEMLTAQPAFADVNGGRLVAAAAAGDPALASALRPEVPPALDRIIRRCLRKDPEQRWQSLRDVIFALTSLADDGAHHVEAEPASAARPVRTAWTKVTAGAAVALTAFVAGALVVPAIADRGPRPARAIRFAASVPRPASEVMGAGGMAFVSPDGLSLAWVSAGGDGRTVLAVQPFDATKPTVLAGTDDARWPFWSPDSRAIAFFAQGELRAVRVSGGAVETIAKAPAGQGGSWTAHGKILFAPDRTGTIHEVAESGGTPVPVTALDAARGEKAHQWPAILPDGRRFVYFAWNDRPEHRGLYAADRATGERQWIGPSDGGAVFAAPDHLLFTRGGTLVAQRFDERQLRLRDEPRVLHEHVCGSSTNVPPCFSASDTGVLVYHAARLFRHQLAWFTRSGRELDVPIEPGSYMDPMLSPDQSRVLIERHDPSSWQLGIWQFDLQRHLLSRIIDGPGQASGPVWSGDGRALAFSSDSVGRHEVYVAAAGGGAPEVVFSASSQIGLSDWSSDGRLLLYQVRGAGTREDVWVLPLEGDRTPVPFVRSRFSERQARFSADGRWIAYVSDESGRPEVYIQPFPPTGIKRQVSNDGGHEPSWRRDGGELYYLTGDRHLMAMPLRVSNDVTLGTASELFRIPRDAPFAARRSYAPAADGRRFLVNVAAPDRVRLPLFETQVVVNWTATLQVPGSSQPR